MDKERIVVAVSGGFDPVHIGHLRMFEEAKKLGTHLLVIVNNDKWLHAKKGYAFMPEQDRVEIIKGFSCVDEVILTEHGVDDEDTSVCRELSNHRPHIFANGGDRKEHNVPEYDVCKSLGIELIFNVGGDKLRSSSELVKNSKESLSQAEGAHK